MIILKKVSKIFKKLFTSLYSLVFLNTNFILFIKLMIVFKKNTIFLYISFFYE